MKRIISGFAIGAVMITANVAFAHPGAGGHMMGGAAMGPQTTTQSGIHPQTTTSTTTPQAHAFGQPNQSCGSATAPNTPGASAGAPGSAFNPNGVAGTKYAGEQPQNSNNPAAVSQYDAACANQPH